jgi:hypothetical protein
VASFINNLDVLSRQEVLWVKTPVEADGGKLCDTLTAVAWRRRK